MCIICVEFELGKLTPREAVRAMGEFKNTGAITEEHADELAEKIEEEYNKGDSKE